MRITTSIGHGATEKRAHHREVITLAQSAPFLDRNLSRCERLSWLLVYLLAFAMSGVVCYQLVGTYLASPFTMSVEPIEDGLYREVFPAITICNIRKWLAPSYKEDELTAKVDWIKSRIGKAMPHCSWKAVGHECRDIFDPVLTDLETFCYSFNYGHPERHVNLYAANSSDDDKDDAAHSFVAERAKTSRGLGVPNGLSVIFDQLKGVNGVQERHDLISLRRESLGYVVLVHHPDEFPMMSGPSMHITAGLENNFRVEITKFVTSSSVKSHPVGHRHKNCYFDGERKLALFNVYSVSACRMECILNLTIEKCGCYHWTTPGFPPDKRCSGDNGTLCHATIVDALQKNEEREYVDHWRRCNCLTRCTYTRYVVTSSYALMDAASVASRFNKTPEYARWDMVILNVFFGDKKVMVYRRDVLSTISSLCSNIGGILGSILGWNVISVVRLLFTAIYGVKGVVIFKKKNNKKKKMATAAAADDPPRPYVIDRSRDK